jgi:hypothetical protein
VCFGIVSQLFGCPVGMVGWPRVPACVRCRTGLVLLDILFFHLEDY